MFANRLTLPLAAAVLFATPALALAGDTHRVPADFDTIQDAIDAAAPGDVILVGNGIFKGAGNKDLNPLGKDLVIRSENGAGHTVLDCEATPATPARGFIFENGETRATVLEGFTICNAATLDGAVSDPFNGGAVQIMNSSPTIRNCTFIENYAGCWGSAIYAGHGGSPLIENCHFENNYAGDDGGALFLWNGAEVTVVNSVFIRNEAAVTGGAIAGFGGGTLVADRITVVDNVSPNGSAILSFDDTTITNSIIWGNTGSVSQIWASGTIDVSWSIVPGTFNANGSNNLTKNPHFKKDGFHLKMASPAVNAGDPNFVLADGPRDIDGQRRVQGMRVDMGADEFPIRRKGNRGGASQSF